MKLLWSTFTTKEIVNSSVQHTHDKLQKYQENYSLPKELFPSSPTKLDMYAYRTVYDVKWNKTVYMRKSPLDVIGTALMHLRFD